MFRAWLGAMPRSLGRHRPAAQSTAAAEALRKLFVTQTRKASYNPWQRSAGFHRTLLGSSRFGATRPRFATRQGGILGQPKRGFRFSPWQGNKGNGKEAGESLSLGQRFKKLSKEYGKAAVGVYFALSVLDYPFFFLLVKAVGTERIAKVEHYVVSTMSKIVPEPIRISVREYWDTFRGKAHEEPSNEKLDDQAEAAGWGVDEARERHQEEASLATQLALAYAVHKSFIFIRIPLTAAVTPRVVKTLRSWGWNIGKPLRKST